MAEIVAEILGKLLLFFSLVFLAGCSIKAIDRITGSKTLNWRRMVILTLLVVILWLVALSKAIPFLF